MIGRVAVQIAGELAVEPGERAPAGLHQGREGGEQSGAADRECRVPEQVAITRGDGGRAVGQVHG